MPYERLGIFITLIQVVQHRFLQCSNRRVASAPHASFGHFRKQSFHQIQPTGTGGREMDVIAGMAQQPSSHLLDLVGSVVVHYQVDFKTETCINVLEEAQKLLMAMPAVATADRDPAGDIQSRE